MDVGSFNELTLQLVQSVGLSPQVGAGGLAYFQKNYTVPGMSGGTPFIRIILFFGKYQVRETVVSAERVADTCLFVCDIFSGFIKSSLLSDTLYPTGGSFVNVCRTFGLCCIILHFFFCGIQRFLPNRTRLPPTVQFQIPYGCCLRYAGTPYRRLLYRYPLPVSHYPHLQLLSQSR